MSCEAIGITIRTYQRWKNGSVNDLRKGAKKKTGNKLTEEETKKIIETCCSQRFKDLNPYEIVAILAEEGIYLASESTIYRCLRKHGLLKHRTNDRVRRKRRQAEELKATGANQVWSWDITYLKTQIKGKYYFLYLFMDVWTRGIVGWGIYEEESSELAKELIKALCKKHGIENIKLRSDNGAVMKSAHVLATLYFLGVIPSFSRPGVSNDNPYSESLFKTLKYTAGYPGSFKSIEEACQWMKAFEKWYNYEHRHSRIGYVTPMDRLKGIDKNKFEVRNKTMEEAYKKHPERFKGKVRRWEKVEVVYINQTVVGLTEQ